MSSKPKRHFLKAKDAKNLLDKMSAKLRLSNELFFEGKVDVELLESEGVKIIMLNGKPEFFKIGEEIYPTLVYDEYFRLAPKVVVDMGAVPFVCKGANIMAPGIRGYEGGFEKGDLVFIVDEKHGKPLALGEALYGEEEMKGIKKGAVIKNVHFVGDTVWNLMKHLASQGSTIS